MLDRVSLEVEAGARVAITGPSGAGKSSLLNVLGLLERLQSGRYFLEGLDVTHKAHSELADLRASSVGFVFQAFHLMPELSVFENVVLGSRYAGQGRAARRSRALQLLEQVGLGDRSGALPLELSGGQQQRVAIARALAASPRLVLCDEPTGNLDQDTSETVMDVLRHAIDPSAALVVVTHDEHLAKRFSQRIVLSGMPT